MFGAFFGIVFEKSLLFFCGFVREEDPLFEALLVVGLYKNSGMFLEKDFFVFWNIACDDETMTCGGFEEGVAHAFVEGGEDEEVEEGEKF